MLFEELIQQHRVDGFIAHGRVDGAVVIAHHQIGTWRRRCRCLLCSLASGLAIGEAMVKKQLHNLRQRYRWLLRDEVAQTVDNPADVDDEILHLCAVLAASAIVLPRRWGAPAPSLELTRPRASLSVLVNRLRLRSFENLFKPGAGPQRIPFPAQAQLGQDQPCRSGKKRLYDR
jgi:hypothetical protein